MRRGSTIFHRENGGRRRNRGREDRSSGHNLNITNGSIDEYYRWVYSIGIFICKNDTSLYIFIFFNSFLFHCNFICIYQHKFYVGGYQKKLFCQYFYLYLLIFWLGKNPNVQVSEKSRWSVSTMRKWNHDRIS